jgi:hypothetical protein
MIFFGWEHNGLLFGQEMRTQTFGTLILLMVIMIDIIQYSKGERRSTGTTIAVVIMLMGMVTISFAVVFYSIIAFLTVIVGMRISGRSDRLRFLPPHLTWRIYIFFLIFFLGYMLYVGNSFDSIIPSMLSLIEEAFYKADTGISMQFYAPLYGYLISYLLTILTTLFLLFTIEYLLHRRNLKTPSQRLFIFCFGSLAVLFIFNNLIGPLSAARIYVIAFALIAVATSVFLLRDFPPWKWHNISLNKIALVLFVYLFIISAIAMNPSYVIGNTEPVRGIEPIDMVHYWDADIPQYALSSFILKTIDNRTTHSFMLIKNYKLREVAEINNLTDAKSAYMGQDEIIILHDKFRNDNYTYRNKLPSIAEFSNFDLILTNGDYLMFFT